MAPVARGLDRLDVILGEFRRLVEAGLAMREQMAASSDGAGWAPRVSLYKRRAARLPHLGDDAAALNSQLRADLSVGGASGGGARRWRPAR